MVVNAGADDPNLRAQSMKGAFLVNFLNFIDWTDHPSDVPEEIVLVGPEDEVRDIEEILRGQPSYGSRFVLSHRASLAEVEHAALVYCLETSGSRAPGELSRLRRIGAVTVADDEGFIENGGTIQFVKVQNRLRFRINAEHSQDDDAYRISSKLLKLAVR